MICEICGKNSESSICDKCLSYDNMANYSKHISNEFYNIGLRKAKSKDISGAIKDLEKSIAYDNDNYYSRNLIGLCYYEIGMFGEASKHWFLSAYNDFEDNNVQGYIDKIGENLSKNKGLMKSIELYNQALEKMQNKEIAVANKLLIEATEKNENLVPALNLLIFLNLMQGQKEKAIPIIDRVLAIDAKNEQALYYYSLATKNKYRPNTNTLPNMQVTQQRVEEPVRRVDNSSIAMKMLAVVAITAVATYFLTTFLNGSQSGYEELQTKYQTELETSKTNADNYAKTLSEKETEITTLKTENQDLTSQLQIYKNEENLLEAQEYYSSRDYVEAASKLYQINKDVLAEEYLDDYDKIADTSFENAIDSLYDSGYNKFTSEDFVDSKSDLQNAYLYCDKVEVSDELVSSIVYYLARSCEELEDNTQAIENYNILLNEYPDYAKDSEERIGNIS